jgi:hypothetical protein
MITLILQRNVNYIPILYLSWWNTFNKSRVCNHNIKFFIVYVGCRYCLTTNIIFGITDQIQCKKCKRISSINITNINIDNYDKIDSYMRKMLVQKEQWNGFHVLKLII